MTRRALAIWFLLLVLANAIGAIKVFFVYPKVGEFAGQIVGTLVFCPVIVAVAWRFVGWIGPVGVRGALFVGLFWVLLTLGFEFLAGHFLFGNSWEKLFSSYEIWNGELWVLVPVTLLTSPALAVRLRRKTQHGGGAVREGRKSGGVP